jgi:hypothetical protein
MVAGTVTINSVSAQIAAVKFVVKVPEASQNTSSIFLTGSFNGWNPRDSFYIMNREKENLYSLVVPLFEGGNYQYKYTLGGWGTVETDHDDSDIRNRKLYSHNGISVNDTVMKWKVPAAVQQKSLSPQLQKMVAIKDSAVAKLKIMLSDLLISLKEYNENMLGPQSSPRVRKKLNKQNTEILSKAYLTIEDMVWQAGTSLTKEQKEKILAATKNSADPKDVLNNIIKAYATVLK